MKPPTEKESLNFKVTLRLYGAAKNCYLSHSYVVADSFANVSSPLGQFYLDIRSITLSKFRPMIEYDRSNHMDRRSMIFQEALFLMSRLPNYYNRPTSDLKEYRFGFLKKDDYSVFKLIPMEDEDKPLGDLLGAVEIFEFDLCIVPLSQIPP